MFEKFNDYELLYLIKEGNPKAFDLLIDKYQILSSVIANNYIQLEFDKDDMIQEGLLVLLDCIKNYNELLGVSFFSYFSISLKRKYGSMAKQTYVRMSSISYNSTFWLEEPNPYFSCKQIGNYIKEIDELLIDIFNKCMIGNLTLRDYARINNISINIVYKKYDLLKKEIKEYLYKYCDIVD